MEFITPNGVFAASTRSLPHPNYWEPIRRHFGGLPRSVTTQAGATVTFRVQAIGAAPMFFQWSKAGVGITGATNSSLLLEAVQVSDSGPYTLSVTNSQGSTTSLPAQLTVLPLVSGPLITSQPQSVTTNSGATVTFSAQSTGTPPLFHQWRKGAQAIPGETRERLRLEQVLTTDSAVYRLVVSNALGWILSQPAILTVLPPAQSAEMPVLESQPPSRLSTFNGASLNISVTASGTAPMHYQWFKDLAPLTGGTNPLLTLEAVEPADSGLYQVDVSNVAGRVSSTGTTLSVLPMGISNLRATPRPDANLVDIWYDLGSPAAAFVAIGASTNGGASWDARIRTLAGDVNLEVQPGTLRRVTWDVGEDCPNIVGSNVKIRVTALETHQDSPAFSVDTRQIASFRLRAWIDANGNDRFDPGEATGGAEAYYDGRTVEQRAGVTGADGTLEITRPLREGAQVFLRKRAHIEPAVKPGHDAVNDVMFTVWRDSDTGAPEATPTTGDWLPRRISASERDRAIAGDPVEVRLGHWLFEWNLAVASEIASEAFLEKLRRGFLEASRQLYDATDGQMKFGAVAIDSDVRQGTPRWTQADMLVYSAGHSRAQTETLTSLSFSAIRHPGNLHMHFGPDCYTSAPDTPKYAYAIVHEFCHYALGMFDEYENGQGGSQANWYIYRRDHPEEAPALYGLMDGQDTELSSYNDYLPTYSGPVSAAGREHITAQLFRRNLAEPSEWNPCWPWMESFLGRWLGNALPDLDLVAPPRGYYQGAERRSSQDRPGPLVIPGPYDDCEFPAATASPGAASLRTWSATGKSFDGLVNLEVVRHGAPIGGAQVTHQLLSRNRVSVVGRTDAAGRLSLYDLEAGDLLLVRTHGKEQAFTVRPLEPLIVLELGTEQDAQERHQPLKTSRVDDLAMVVACTLGPSPSDPLALRLVVNQALNGLPSATLHIDDGPGAQLDVTSLTPTSFLARGLLSASTSGGSLEWKLVGADSDLLSSADLFALRSVSPTEATTLYARSGAADVNLEAGCVASDTLGIIYEGYAPVIPPDRPSAVLIGPVVSVALGAALHLNGTSAGLNFYYRDADLAGVDETTIGLYRWKPVDGHWVGETFAHAGNINVVSARVTELGVFALFAEPASDTVPPGTITDLSASTGTNGWTVVVSWTAPGDDGAQGTVTEYLLRYGTEEVTTDTWDQTPATILNLVPQTAGLREACVLPMPNPGVPYFFAVRARDEAGNPGPISNSAVARSCQADRDGDGMSDAWELTYQFNPDDPSDAGGDVDGDGLTNAQEARLGANPRLWDSDGDGMSDRWESEQGLNPASAGDRDLDRDDDGLSNLAEFRNSTDSNLSDTDGDGLPDAWEVASDLCPFSTSKEYGADGDPDQDGRVNLDEYLLGSNPWVSDSVRIGHCRFITDGAFQLAVLGEPGRTYSLDISTNLVDWVTVTSFVCTNASTVVTDPNTAAFNCKYYRVGPGP